MQAIGSSLEKLLYTHQKEKKKEKTLSITHIPTTNQLFFSKNKSHKTTTYLV